jgi:outer membrane protein OmpA-like peptidoglycan-associated protein
MLDNASDIYPIPCDVERPQVVDKEPPSTPDQPQPPVVADPKPAPDQPVVQSKKEKILKELDKDKIREGQTIRIDKLYFKADSSSITEQSYPVLDEIYEFLVENPSVVVEIGGHTNGIPSPEYCDKLSTERAKAVADYLILKGIDPERLKYKGYGKRQPIDTNRTAAGRKRNQRVEIKILSLNG